jgi:hypothetical protein
MAGEAAEWAASSGGVKFPVFSRRKQEFIDLPPETALLITNMVR